MKLNQKPFAWVPTLYVAEALPYVAVMVIATTMYKRLGLSNTELALYTSWLYLPWVVKPLWSPLVAAVKTERWWVLAMQLLIGAGFATVALTLPTTLWLKASLAGFWLLAFASATHDIAADGLYIVALNTHDQSLYVGVRSTCYRIGNILGQGGLVMLAGWLEERMGVKAAWSTAFMVMAGAFVGLWLWHHVALPKLEVTPYIDNARAKADADEQGASLWRIFVSKPKLTASLLFMLLFRFPEAQLVKIANPFMLDSVAAGGLGLKTEAVGFAYGTVGIVGLTIGGLLGGWLVSRYGLRRMLWPMVASISLPDIVYVYMAVAKPAFGVVNACVFVEQAGYGIGFTAYMLYMVYFAQGPRSTAVFSICTAVQALGMMLPGMMAGWVADTLGYQSFFWWVMVCCVVTVVVSAFISIDDSYGRKGEVKEDMRKEKIPLWGSKREQEKKRKDEVKR